MSLVLPLNLLLHLCMLKRVGSVSPACVVCDCPTPCPAPKDLSPLASMCWHSSGLRFVSGHRDGTVVQWRVDPEEEGQGHVIVQKKYFGMWERNACIAVVVTHERGPFLSGTQLCPKIKGLGEKPITVGIPFSVCGMVAYLIW